ncbi:MAG: ATP-dependent Clp protease proteolytic subunit [Candidatus Paceibacterota bacterium]|jgi:ATP-dependent Clp protease protease subunit
MDTKELKTEFDLDLFRKRILYLHGEITDQMAAEVGAAIVWLNALSSEPITIYVDSPGGKAGAGLDIVDAIKNSTAPVDAIIYRRANSMASVVTQACRRRMIMRGAEMLLHAIRVDRPLDVLEDDAERAKSLAEISGMQRRVEELFAARTGQDIDKIRQLIRVGENVTRLNAEKALELGFVDKII